MRGINIKKALAIYKFFEEESDAKHKLTWNEIEKRLFSLGIKIDAKTFYSYVHFFQDQGIDIITERSDHFYYYLGERLFDFVEIKVIIDALYSSSVFDEEKCRHLSEKLLHLVSRHQANEIRREQLPIVKRNSFNQYFYVNIDHIYQAMLMDKKIKFQYFTYALDQKGNLQRINRKNDKEYVVSPYAFYYKQDNYYVLVSDDQHEGIASYRVDRMNYTEVLYDQERKPLESCDLQGTDNLKQYVTSMISMYGSTSTSFKYVRLQFEERILDSVIDQFSAELNFIRNISGWIECRVKVIISPTFYSWVFQFGKGMRILDPEEVVLEYTTYLKENLNIYME